MARSIPGPLQTLLDGGVTTLCLCWRVDRQDGVSLGFTDHDVDLTIAGLDYKRTSSFSASAIEDQLGLAVSNLDVLGALSSDSISEIDLDCGRYDGAVVTVYLVNWADVTQLAVLSHGTLGQVQSGDMAYQAELRSLAQNFAQYIGALCAPRCRSPFGDTGKGLEGGCAFPLAPPVFATTTAYALGAHVVPAVANGYQYEVTTAGTSGGAAPAFPTVVGATVTSGSVTFTARRAVTRTGVVTAVTNRKTFSVGSILGDLSDGTGGSLGGGFFAEGTVKFSSGNNINIAKEILSFTGGAAIVTKESFGADITVGDAVILQAGCDKTLEVCRANYNRVLFRRAEDYVPGSGQVFRVNGEG